MPEDAFHDFFAASAAVLGALIGLLFVAMSVSQARFSGRGGSQPHRIRASAALTVFTNALVVSLFALIPGVHLGWPAVIVAAFGELFVLASLLSLIRVSRTRMRDYRESLFLVGFAVVFAFQLITGIQLTGSPRDPDLIRTIATLVVICSIGGIGRSWELIGGPEIGLRGEFLAAVRGRRRDAVDDRDDAGD